jgi:hypothetical protein
MMRKLDYRSANDMRDLAYALDDLPDDAGPSICAFIVDHDLMRPQWWMRLGFWFVRLRHGHTRTLWTIMEQRFPGSCRELIDGTVMHIRHGRDRTTRDAAGGFNQKEADLLSAAIMAISREQGQSA